jgi:hypothetical protein
VADLSAVAGRTGQRRSVDDEAASHPDRPPDEDDVVDAARRSPTVLSEDRQIGFVRQGHRHRHAERLAQSLPERLVAPPEVRRHGDHPVAAPHDADDGHADPEDRRLSGQPAADGRCQVGERGRDVGHAGAPARKIDAHEIEHRTAESDRGGRQGVDGDLERHDDGPVGVGTDDRRGTARGPVERGRSFDRQVAGDELADESADRAAGQPGPRDELGAG